MIVMVIGLGAIAVSRIEGRMANLSHDHELAGRLAFSAVEHAMTAMHDDPDWKSTYGYGVPIDDIEFGGGVFRWSLHDEIDGVAADGATDMLRIRGEGVVGQITRVCSVAVFSTGPPRDLLRAPLHASGEIGFRSGSNPVVFLGGPLSTNDVCDAKHADLIADVEADSVRDEGNIAGTIIEPAPPKSMPSTALLDVYRTFATTIDASTLPWSWELRDCLLSPYHSPEPDGDLNVDGVYFIEVPEDETLLVEDCRIEGTLLVVLRRKARLEVKDGVVWRPFRRDFPALIVYTDDDESRIELECEKTVSESVTGVNLNPSVLPLDGASDNDTLDTFDASLDGVFHIIRDAPSGKEIKVKTPMGFRGTIIVHGDVEVDDDSVLIADPQLMISPPLGYSGGGELTVLPTTWKWE
jgi:hypothetical protein